ALAHRSRHPRRRFTSVDRVLRAWLSQARYRVTAARGTRAGRREPAQGPPLQQTRRQSLGVEIPVMNRETPPREPGLLPTFGCANGEILEAAGTAGENAQILERIRTLLVEAAGVEPSK